MRIVRDPNGLFVTGLPVVSVRRCKRQGLLASLMLGAVVAACGGGAVASPVVVAPSFAPAATVPVAPTPAPERTASAALASTPIPATPAPTMPASLVGAWEGTVNEPGGVVKEFAETYAIEPCDADVVCGSFEVRGPVVEERLDSYPWARMGTTWRCSGVLLFNKMDGDEALFIAASTSADPPEGLSTCGKMPFGLRPTADGGLTFTSYVWGKTVAQRGLLLPVAETPSPE